MKNMEDRINITYREILNLRKQYENVRRKIGFCSVLGNKFCTTDELNRLNEVNKILFDIEQRYSDYLNFGIFDIQE